LNFDSDKAGVGRIEYKFVNFNEIPTEPTSVKGMFDSIEKDIRDLAERTEYVGARQLSYKYKAGGKVCTGKKMVFGYSPDAHLKNPHIFRSSFDRKKECPMKRDMDMIRRNMNHYRKTDGLDIYMTSETVFIVGEKFHGYASIDIDFMQSGLWPAAQARE